MRATIRVGDALAELALMDTGSVQTCITSPPYFGLRDYGTGEWEGGAEGCDHVKTTQRGERDRPRGWDGPFRNTGEPLPVSYGDVCGKCGATRTDKQLGLEATPDEYVAKLVAVFREVRRVLRDDGTLWLNLGDSYNSVGGTVGGAKYADGGRERQRQSDRKALVDGVKPKDLLGIPWMVAFALRADGWYLRSEIIWAKPNPMPESVTDRPTKAHEQVFLLAKSPRYFYDADAIREAHDPAGVEHFRRYGANPVGRECDNCEGTGKDTDNGAVISDCAICDGTGRISKNQVRRDSHGDTASGMGYPDAGRNKRSVWTVATQPYPEAHFATFPPKLIEPMVLAGCPRQACGVCGAPWERQTEREDQGYDGSTYGERAVEATGGAVSGGTARSTLGSSNGKLTGRRIVTGFAPTCSHDDDSASGVVLDPFAGSGTTLRVALAHGRSAIGIELNPAYAALARRRLEGVTPSMFDTAALSPREDA